MRALPFAGRILVGFRQRRIGVDGAQYLVQAEAVLHRQHIFGKQVARVFVDDCIARHLDGKLDVATAAMAKYWTTDLQCEVVDQCLQFHGGYGYMWEFPIARLYADARVQKIYGGTNEIMKELIGRTL